MSREQEFQYIKETIKEYYSDGDCGLYNTRNLTGDSMINIFDGKYFKLDLCDHYSYFEIFGTAKEEFEELKKFYERLEAR